MEISEAALQGCKYWLADCWCLFGGEDALRSWPFCSSNQFGVRLSQVIPSSGQKFLRPRCQHQEPKLNCKLSFAAT